VIPTAAAATPALQGRKRREEWVVLTQAAGIPENRTSSEEILSNMPSLSRETPTLALSLKFL